MKTKSLHDNLYYEKEIIVTHPKIADGKEIELSIKTRAMTNTEPDCKIGHFGYNFFLRTNYGIKGKPYSSAKRMEKAIEKTLINKGFKIIKWTTTNQK